MPWSDYREFFSKHAPKLLHGPGSLKSGALKAGVAAANSAIHSGKYDEGQAIAIGIAAAKRWTKKGGKK
jgi:hypothetical protein